MSLSEFCSKAGGRARSKAGGASADRNNLQRKPLPNMSCSRHHKSGVSVRNLNVHTEIRDARCLAICQ